VKERKTGKAICWEYFACAKNGCPVYRIIKGTPGSGYDVIQKSVHSNALLQKIRSILARARMD